MMIILSRGRRPSRLNRCGAARRHQTRSLGRTPDPAKVRLAPSPCCPQASDFELHGVALDGKLTACENIADLGGLRVALDALCALTDGGADAPPAAQPAEMAAIAAAGPIDHDAQRRFFFAWARLWCENVTLEKALHRLSYDPHGPSEWRVGCPLSN